MAKDKAYYQQFLTNANVVAYLNTIASTEAPTYYTKGGGAVIIPKGPEHPAGELVNGSDSFGRYQFISTTWKEVSDSVGGLDIREPRDQDVAIIAKIDQLGYLEAIVKGDCINAANGLVGTWDGIRASGGPQAFCNKLEKFKGTTLPKGPLVNNDSPIINAGAGSALTSLSPYSSANFSDINCPPIKEEDLYRANFQITNPGCKITGPIQPITGPSTNGGTVRSSNPTNNSVGFSVNAQGFGQCSSLRSPTKGVAVNSPFGWRWGKMHNGVDLAAPTGTPIYAASNGVVDYAQWNDGGYGNRIEIVSPEGIRTTYSHLEVIKCSAGQTVNVGQQIADMGSTGFSTGPHLHFEVQTGAVVGGALGSFIDPQSCITFN